MTVTVSVSSPRLIRPLVGAFTNAVLVRTPRLTGLPLMVKVSVVPQSIVPTFHRWPLPPLISDTLPVLLVVARLLR